MLHMWLGGGSTAACFLYPFDLALNHDSMHYSPRFCTSARYSNSALRPSGHQQPQEDGSAQHGSHERPEHPEPELKSAPPRCYIFPELTLSASAPRTNGVAAAPAPPRVPNNPMTPTCSSSGKMSVMRTIAAGKIGARKNPIMQMQTAEQM